MKKTRILLADDHVILLDALVSLLGQEFDVVGVAREADTVLELAKRLQPDIVVLDISMPQMNGIDAARLLRQQANPAKILFLSMYADLPLVEDAFRAGASGYVLKAGDTGELVKAIQRISRGGTYVTPLLGDMISTLLTTNSQQRRQASLTSRQCEVLRLLAEGHTMKEIGELLNITARTTESHKYEIMRHLGVKTTAELIRYAIRNLPSETGNGGSHITANPPESRI
jgi:DNA-binding NarL/FixJ family response regulator